MYFFIVLFFFVGLPLNITMQTKTSTHDSSDFQENKRREQEFKQKRDQQRQLLAQAQSRLKQLEAESDRLKGAFDANEKILAELETILDQRSGNLGEMQGTVKVLAGDLRSIINESIVSAEFPGRDEFLTQLASQTKLPNIRDLRQLWLEMQKQITESGKISRFTTSIRDEQGEVEPNVAVTRIGSFNAFDSEGNFLVWSSPEQNDGRKGELQRLVRQPSAQFRGMAEDFVEASNGETVQAPIDYSRGTILKMMSGEFDDKRNDHWFLFDIKKYDFLLFVLLFWEYMKRALPFI